MTPDVLQSFNVKCQPSRSQRETSPDRHIIALFYEIRITESNGNVRIFTGSCKIAVCSHAQCKMAKNSPERLARRRAAFKLQCLPIATYSSYFFVFFLQQLVIYQLLAIYDVFCIVSCLVSFNIITLFPIS